MCLVLCSGAPMAGVDLEDVKRGLRDAAAAVESFSFTFRCERMMRLLPDGDEDVSLHEEAAVVADARGRGRYEGRRSGVNRLPGGKTKIFEEMALGAFDGKVMKSMEGIGKYSLGRITGKRYDLPWQMDPWNYLNRYFNEPVYEVLEKRGAVLAGSTTWQGRPVLTVETRPVARAGDKESLGKYRFLVDVERNFTVVEKAALVKLSPALDWAVYTRISGYDYVEETPGVWVPMRLEHESLMVKKEEVEKGIPPKANWRWNIKVDEWKVNQPLADSLFEVPFPPGLFVNDQIQGGSYQVTEDIAMTTPPEAARRRGWGVLAGAAVILALLALVVIAQRFRARRERGAPR